LPPGIDRNRESLPLWEALCFKVLIQCGLNFLLVRYGKHFISFSVSSLEYIIEMRRDEIKKLSHMQFFDL